MTLYASADVIACAYVVACDILDADPLSIYEQSYVKKGKPFVRARYLAFHAVVAIMPKVEREALARGLGFSSPKSALSNVQNGPLSGWWRKAWVDEIAEAVRAALTSRTESAPEAAIAAPAAPVVHTVTPPIGENTSPEAKVAIEALVRVAAEQLREMAPIKPPLRSLEIAPRRAPARRVEQALPMGEPDAGRSALDRRRAGVEERESCASGRKSVSLPRLSCLEKGLV
jgi:hypothetical protein